MGRLGRRARGGQAGDAAETPAAASAAAAVPCKSAGSRSAAKMERMAKPGVAVQTVATLELDHHPRLSVCQKEKGLVPKMETLERPLKPTEASL